MTAINQQTPGPAKVVNFDNAYGLSVVAHGPGNERSGSLVAQLPQAPQEYRANARLLAAAYTAFDGAGRKLGIDAAEMAERLGPEGLAEIAAVLKSILGCPQAAPWLARLNIDPEAVVLGPNGPINTSPTVFDAARVAITLLIGK
ncbi:hypothetical protein ABMY26_06490 (plasmid) [Azospirillum sp. HJ39]|uniref:hypothetical protein n=1 Tax=Azospirillum sp. HJ39 TaxID=3159496 RepID=UPI003555D881